MLSKGLHRSQASIFNKLGFELHTRGEASLLLQMQLAGARTSFPPNTPFLGDVFGLCQLNQTWRKIDHEPQRLFQLENSVSCSCSEEWGDAPKALRKCFLKN